MKNPSLLILVVLALAVQFFTRTGALGQDKIRIGVPLFPTVAFPAFVAREKAFFEKNGLQVEIIRINSEPTTYQALVSGSIDATAGAPAGLVLANLQGVSLVALGSWDNVVPYTLATRERIDDLSKLKGKKIGVNRIGGKSSLIVRVMLEEAGLDPMKDVTLLQLGGSQERLAALMRGGIDAAPVDYSLEPKMKKMGFFLGTGRKTPFMNGPFVVKTASLRSDAGKWKRFVTAILEATHYLMTQKNGTLEVLRRVTQIDDKESLGFIYEQMRSRADVNLRPSRAAVENLVKMVAYDDKRASSLDASKLLDLSMVSQTGTNKPQQ